MTQEEKAKAYDEALERARAINSGKDIDVEAGTTTCEYIFPELKESEDEKIRKEIISLLQYTKGRRIGYEPRISQDDMIAWLEKQESVEEIVARCKDSWYNEGKIAGMAEGLSDEEKYQQGWHDALEKQGEKPQGKTALEAVKEEKVDNANKVEPKFKIKLAGREYNVLEIKESAGVTFYGIEDEPNHIDYVLSNDCEIVSGYGVKEKGNSYPTKSAIFSEHNSAWSNEYSNGYNHAVEKAVEWLENHNDYIDVKDGNVTYFDMEKCVEDFRKAMKGGEE